MRQKQLIMVTESNNNKFYNMIENTDSTFTAKWGRVGATENTTVYPISKWESQYTSKIKKGYKDITSLKSEAKTTAFSDVQNSVIQKLLDQLQKYAKQSISENYTVTSEQVTQQQIDKAQEILNSISLCLTKTKFNAPLIDSKLTELYTTIPRKMRKVQDFILNGTGDLKKAKEIVKREQDSIDIMAQQVSMNVPQTSKTQTLEEALGLKIEECNTEEVETIKKMMGNNVSQFKNAYKVINHNTQKAFDEQKKKSVKHWTKLLFHGSRNENWLNIIKTGLLVRPTCAIFTGAMFGNGIYLADKAQKSIGYTSLSGSYWASGQSRQAFLAIYEVNTGMEYRVEKHSSEFYDYNENKLRTKGQYDSLFAKGGIDLKNNEYIVYNRNQVTIKYFVEIGE